MKIYIQIKHYHAFLQVGLEDIRNAWYFPPGKPPFKLKTIIHQGQLFYRFPVSGKRISYRTLKKGLLKKQILIPQDFELFPF